MNSRRGISLLLLVCIVLASLCLIPAGHGPYSVVYGPRAPLRAYRASVQLMQAMVAIVVVSVASIALSFSRPVVFSIFDDDSSIAPGLSALSVLRC